MTRNALFAACLLAVGAVASTAFSAQGTPFDFAPRLLSVSQPAVPVVLPDGSTQLFRTTVEHPEPGLTGVRGQAADGSRLAMFLSGERILSGDARTGTGHFQLVEHDGGYVWIRNEDNAAEMTLDEAFDLSKPDVLLRAAQLPAQAQATAPPVAEPGPDGNYLVDLLVVHTPLFEQRYGGAAGVRAEAQRLVFLANDAFANSGIPVRYRALAIERYTGTSESAYGGRNLRILMNDPAIKAYRDRIGADLVVLLRTLDGRVDVAVSTGFNARGVPPEGVNADQDAYAVSVTGHSAAGRKGADFIFMHELGHNLAAGHNWLAHQFDNIYWQPHAHGWSCGIAGGNVRYASIMSYGDVDMATSNQVREARGDFFSTPLLSSSGMPCGMPADPLAPEALQADNASIITQAAPYVAAYRKAPGSR